VEWQPRAASDAHCGASKAFLIKTFGNFVMLSKRCEGRDWRDDAEEEASDALWPSPVYEETSRQRKTQTAN